ncbi:MAG TPA: protein kinase [Gemmatimonadales bacterium]|nr:protein kinase [Gemmatimonadales bacterium]
MVRPLGERVQDALGEGYEVAEELPGGGMSRLFVAQDRTLGRLVVIKLLPEDRLPGLSPDRFQREIRLTASLSHANIVGILAAGVIEGIPYYIMPFVEGRSLRNLLDDRGALPVRETVSILRDVARACAFAHAKGIIHRDIKPGNVLLAGGAAVMTDFGVAKAITTAAERSASPSDGTLTRAGFTIGTPAYMAPEQAAGDSAIDHRADLYSFGVMAFEMLTGKVPFKGSTPRELLTAQLTHPPPPITQLRPEVPAALAALIRKCLAKDPADRPVSAEEILAALDEMPAGSGSLPTLQAVGRRNRRIRGVLAVAVVAALAFVGVRLLRSGAGPAHSVAPVTLAVLPFVSRSADSADAYLAQGLTDAIAAALARDSALRVASRLATAEYAERTAPPRTIGRSLGVAALLDGSVQRQGNRIRVTVQLVDTETGAALWSESYDRESADLLEVQEDIANAIVTAFQRQRGGGAMATAGKSGFRVAEAYDRYLQGRYAFGQRGAANLREAVTHFQAAIALDSTAAPAYSGLADAYVLLPLYGAMTVDSALDLALVNADQAVRLDSASAEAVAARGVVRMHRWEWSLAAGDLSRAVALDPRNGPAHQWRGELLLLTGRTREAAAEFTAATELDPRSPIHAALYGLALALLGQRDSATTVAKAAVRLDPALAVTRLIQGAVLAYGGRALQAVGALEGALALEPDNEQAMGLLAYAYASLNDRQRAEELIRKLTEGPPKPDTYSALAKAYLGLKQNDKALGALERALIRHEPFFTSEPMDSPIFAPIQDEQRLADIRAKVGLATPGSSGAR